MRLMVSGINLGLQLNISCVCEFVALATSKAGMGCSGS